MSEIQTINGIEIHPTKRIGFHVGPGNMEFVTDQACMEDASMEVHLASVAAVATLEKRSASGRDGTVFLTSQGADSPTVFISEEEYEDNLLYPSE